MLDESRWSLPPLRSINTRNKGKMVNGRLNGLALLFIEIR